jgi:hypothetical protein
MVQRFLIGAVVLSGIVSVLLLFDSEPQVQEVKVAAEHTGVATP